MPKTSKKRKVVPLTPDPASTRSLSWIAEVTNRPAQEWVGLIQRAIRKASMPTKDPRHDQTNVSQWLAEVIATILVTAPKKGQYDENLRTAAVVGYILLLWYFRCHRAKIHDPRRPIARRREAYAKWLACAAAVQALPLDEREDGVMFPGQKWESPFAWHATDGVFV